MAERELVSENDAVPKRASSDLIEGFSNLNLLRQAGLMVGLAVSVAIGFWVVLWTQGEDYRPLYGSLEGMDSAEVGQILDTNRIPYKVDVSTGALLVPTKEVHLARLKLAEVGIPSNGPAGFELLDQEQPLGTSAFMESARYRRSLEGEMARTISSVHAVRSARVHLAIPKASVFVRDGREPSASVFLELFPGRTLEPHQIRGIANLVASSVPELKPASVTLVDQRGSLITIEEKDDRLAIAAKHRDYTRKIEDDIALRIRRLLSPIIGGDKFKAEVSADVDFTEIEQAAEIFNPELPALRSESTIEEHQIGSGIRGGIPGALTNQPPAGGGAPEQAFPEEGDGTGLPSNTRSQATRNFELDRTVSYTVHEKGRLQRLSVAVVVDDRVVTNADGQRSRVPWTEEELQRLTILIRDAVGFSADRGDSVNILNESFLEVEEIEFEEEPWWKTERFASIFKQLIGLLVIVLLLLGLLRPVLRNLTGEGLKVRAEDEAKALAALQAAGGDDSLLDETVTLTGSESLALPSPEEGYEHQLNAVRGLVADDAGRVAQVIKRWIGEE